VFDDTIITMKHEGYLLCVLISGFVTFIKTGNPLFFKRMCQIGSELIQFMFPGNDHTRKTQTFLPNWSYSCSSITCSNASTSAAGPGRSNLSPPAPQ
ncbi:MAG: hypothetical protein RPU39_11395, partial [Candidatus Sedimenticola sp. (ex Thyasira tokunagai)]